MKTMVSGGVVRALVALGLVSYHAAPVLAAEKSTTFNTQLQWVIQLIVKEKATASAALTLQSTSAGGVDNPADTMTVQRW